MNKKVIIAITLIVVAASVASVSYFLLQKSNPSTKVFIYPNCVHGEVGENFTVYVNVSNVVDLYGWEFKLSWNTSMLNLTSVSEGSFLKNYGETFMTKEVKENNVHILCTLMGNVSGANGNGVLASLKFHINNPGNSILQLYDVILLNSDEEKISCVVKSCSVYT